MNTARIWTFGAVLAIVAIVGAALALGVAPQLQAASAADAQTQQTVTQNAALQADVARLTRVAAQQETLDATDLRLRRAVPSTLKLNTFSRGLRDIAALDGVTIEAFAPSIGMAYSAPADAHPVVAAPAAGTTATPAPTASAAAAPQAAVAPVVSGWFGQTDPLITSADLTVVPVTLVVAGPAAAVQTFASDVQRADRLFAVSGFTTTSTEGVTTANITGTIYALQR